MGTAGSKSDKDSSPPTPPVIIELTEVPGASGGLIFYPQNAYHIVS